MMTMTMILSTQSVSGCGVSVSMSRVAARGVFQVCREPIRAAAAAAGAFSTRTSLSDDFQQRTARSVCRRQLHARPAVSAAAAADRPSRQTLCAAANLRRRR